MGGLRHANDTMKQNLRSSFFHEIGEQDIQVLVHGTGAPDLTKYVKNVKYK